MNRIHAYYQLALKLMPKSDDIYYVEGIDNIYRHKLFEQIVNDKTIRVKIIDGPYGLEDLKQFVISSFKDGVDDVICILHSTSHLGRMFNDDFLLESPDEFVVCKVGYGHYGIGATDAILFKMTEELIFEVYVCKGQREKQADLFDMLRYHQLETDIRQYTDCFKDICSGGYSSLPNVEPYDNLFPGADCEMLPYDRPPSVNLDRFIKKRNEKA